ncbi:lipopolysaccharide assembly protein LapB [Synechococcus sp. UW69]|uniref:tetratricopeptide repeat protein n=1 Tax=Synechococcus sp. UW69 TaxID=368493 RepID=UPI000E0EFD7B|nr:tetratricopeptide repeat protein [Synechococcus sp. UW69]
MTKQFDVSQIKQEQLSEIQTRAESLLQSGKLQAAIDELNRASEDLSEYPNLYRLKAYACLLLGENAEARLIFEQIEGSFGDDPEFLNVFGVALRRERNLSKAKEVYERGLEIKPEEPALLSNYANLLIDMGQFTQARAALEKALTLSPGHKDAIQNMNRLSNSIGDLKQDALNSSHRKSTPDDSNFERISTINKSDPQAAADWLNLAATTQREKNFNESLIFARKALEAQPDMAAAYKLAGELLIAQDNFEDAEKLFLYGLILGDQDTSTLSNLGAILARKRNGPLARIFLMKALQINKKHQASYRNLELVDKMESQPNHKPEPIF